jgi:hypothetical protein
VARKPSEELAALREAREAPTNLAGWCPWCHTHRLNEPAPDPTLCRIPAPEIRGGGRKAPDYQAADGTPIAKDPHAGERLRFGGGGKQHPCPGHFDIPGLKWDRKGCRPPRRGSRRLKMTAVQAKLRPQVDAMACKVEVLLKIPARLRSTKRKPLPDKAIRLIREYHDHVRFVGLMDDGMTVVEAGQEVFGRMSHQTSYNHRNRLRDAGSPGELFRAEAIELFKDPEFPWGHQIQNSPWARAFFVRLIGGPAALEMLRHSCRTAPQCRLTIRQRSEAGDTAIVQAILFGQHSGLIGGLE